MHRKKPLFFLSWTFPFSNFISWFKYYTCMTSFKNNVSDLSHLFLCGQNVKSSWQRLYTIQNKYTLRKIKKMNKRVKNTVKYLFLKYDLKHLLLFKLWIGLNDNVWARLVLTVCVCMRVCACEWVCLSISCRIFQFSFLRLCFYFFS